MLAGRLAVVRVSGTALDLANEALTHIDDNTWQVSTEAKQVLDRDVEPELERDVGGTWTDTDYESVDKLSGTFTFSGSGYANTVDIRVKTGNYLSMASAAFAHEYNYIREIDIHDVTPFLATHIKRIGGMKFASGTISQWDVTDTYFADVLTAGDPVVIEFRGQTSGDPERVWALLESQEMQAAIDGPQDEVVSFISTDELLNL